MEEAFLIVEGSEKTPLVRLRERFHGLSVTDQAFAVYVFWGPSPVNRPDWSLSRIMDPLMLDQLALVLERSLQRRVAPGGLPQSIIMGTVELSRHEKQASVEAPSVSEKNDDIETGIAVARVEENRFAVADDRELTMAKRDFIRLVLDLVLGPEASDFQTVWAHDYVADPAIAKLPQYASVDTVVVLCESVGAVEESYRKALYSLNTKWSELWPTVKAEIHNYFRNSRLSSDEYLVPPLTPADHEDLNVRWDEADCKYGREKEKAFARCRELGCNLDEFVVERDRLDAVMDVLSRLLKEKLDIDRSQVVEDGAKLSRSNHIKIRNRLHTAYLELSEPLREAFARTYPGVADGRVTTERVPLIFPEFAGYFRPLIRNYDVLESSLGLG